MPFMDMLRNFPVGRKRKTAVSIATELEMEHQLRIQRYRRAWKFYDGKHWAYKTDPDDPAVTLNYVRKFVDAHVAFFAGKGFSVTIPDDPTTPNNESDDRTFVLNMLKKTWEWNDKDLWLTQAAQMGSVTGDVFLRLSWETEDPMAELPYCKVEVVPSHLAFPTFAGPEGPNKQNIESVTFIFPKFVVRRDAEDSPMFHKRKAVEYTVETWFKDKVIEWDGEEMTERENVLGEIPVVHFQNLVRVGEFYGISDVQDVIEINREYNEKNTDVSDVINYQGSPVTILKGAKIQNLERGPNRIWGIPAEADITNLSLSSELGASLNYLDRLKDAMHEIGSVPKSVLDSLQAGSASGVALAMRYLPMKQQRNFKILTYRSGLRRVNRLIMKMTALMDPEFRRKFVALPRENRYRNDVVFPDPLPRDESLELDKAEKRISMGISTRKLELLDMGRSQAEADRVLKEVDKERVKDSELELQVGQGLMSYGLDEEQERSGNPNPRRPNPEVAGQRESETAERDLA